MNFESSQESEEDLELMFSTWLYTFIYVIIKSILLLYELLIVRLLFSGDKEKHVLGMYHATVMISVSNVAFALHAFEVDALYILIICLLIPVVLKSLITGELSCINVCTVSCILYFFNEKWKLEGNKPKISISF
jgi:hypothetical protein